MISCCILFTYLENLLKYNVLIGSDIEIDNQNIIEKRE